MILILDDISKIVSLTEAEKELFSSKTERQHSKAKTIFHNSSEISKESYFVHSGLLRSYNINILEHVLYFT